MNMLQVMHGHQHEAEYDAAVWIDNHDRLRRIALLLTHHRVLRAAALVTVSPVLAVFAAGWAIREVWRVIDRVHEIGGEDGTMCPPCAKRDAKALNGDKSTVETFIGLCDLAKLRSTEGGEWL